MIEDPASLTPKRREKILLVCQKQLEARVDKGKEELDEDESGFLRYMQKVRPRCTRKREEYDPIMARVAIRILNGGGALPYHTDSRGAVNMNVMPGEGEASRELTREFFYGE